MQRCAGLGIGGSDLGMPLAALLHPVWQAGGQVVAEFGPALVLFCARVGGVALGLIYPFAESLH